MKQQLPIHSLWLTAIMVLIYGCVDHNFDTPPNPPIDGAVSFRAETSDDFSTRATGHTTTGAHAIRSMGIYAGYTTEAWDDTTAPNNFFDNLSVSRSSDGAPWNYNNEQLWPGNGYLTFFAYAPHSSHAAYNGNPPQLTANMGIPTLHYTIAPTHKQQVDLLVATPVKDQTKRDYVTIPLRHALTKIAFSARVANPPGSDVDIRITEISLSGLYGSGILMMNGSNRQWTALSTSATYTQTNTPDGGLRSLPLTDSYQSLTPTDGHLFLLPQTLVQGSTGATLTVTYETKQNTNAPQTNTIELELARAITQFNPGDAYNLMLTINNGVSFIAVPTPWDNTDVEADSKNRILNITRIEAGVYDGAVTRIFFWSNQPQDSVFVRPLGHTNDNGYPGTTTFNVDTYFHRLSNAQADNLHYNGFDGTSTTSGQGYIDVTHASNYINPNTTDLNESRHIWLTASGLTRSIRLNSHLKGWNATLPYVGTFHRWNEMGERIIAWTATTLGHTDTWTATILDPSGTGADVLIDRQPSPYYGHPFTPLYTTNASDIAAGNPETATVSNYPSHAATVSGTGKRIYFRVGWKTPTANRTTVRYARIQVTTPQEIHTLYLRQGEEADFVMRPNDIAPSIASRPNVVKFSPYNLTEAQLKSGSSQIGAIALDRLNARFTNYPTQAGALFQWGNALNPRYAYSPISPITSPTEWNTTEVSNYWATVKGLYESCPPGYRRPADGSITTQSDNNVANSEIRQSLWSIPQDGTGDTKNNITNSLWGYYADGYFDRRTITHPLLIEGTRNLMTTVSPTDHRVAYIGRLFYNPTTWASLFFPAAGSRANKQGELQSLGLFGDYLTSGTLNISVHDRNYLITSAGEAYMDGTKDSYPHSIRCVRDLIFTTTLPPYDETGVPTTLGFDADARNSIPAMLVDDQFVAKWNIVMARDFRSYLTSDGTIGKITAKVTFRGTTSAADHQVSTNLFASLLNKENSSVAYDFSHANLTWTPNTKFTFIIENGWKAQRYPPGANTPDQTVIGSQETSTPIVLSSKGRIVITRLTP